MRTLLGLIGNLLLFLAAACVVAELLHLVIGDGQGWLSLARVWAGVHGGSLEGFQGGASGTIGGLASRPLGWLLALPSWLVLLALGAPLAMLGRRGRERSGFG